MLYLRGLLLLCASVALLAVSWLCWETIQSERSITSATLQNERSITASIDTVPGIADQHLKVLEGKMDAVTLLAAGAIATIDKRLGSIQSAANVQLAEANRSISQVSGAVAVALPQITKSASDSLASATVDVHQISGDVHQAAAPIASTASQFNDAAPLFLDCEFNEDCIFNRFQGVSKATEQTLQAVAKAAPKIADATAKIEADIQREADAITKPKRWYQKLFGALALSGEVVAHIL